MMLSVFHVTGRCRIDEDRGAGEDLWADGKKIDWEQELD